MHTLKILDLEFTILSATLVETKVGDSVKWDLMIKTVENKLVFNGAPPDIRCDEMRSQWGNIEALQNTTIQVPSAYDDEADEYLFTMYVVAHEDVYDSSIAFGSISGKHLPIHWKGKCNIGWDDKYSSNIPFELETQLELTLS